MQSSIKKSPENILFVHDFFVGSTVKSNNAKVCVYKAVM